MFADAGTHRVDEMTDVAAIPGDDAAADRAARTPAGVMRLLAAAAFSAAYSGVYPRPSGVRGAVGS